MNFLVFGVGVRVLKFIKFYLYFKILNNSYICNFDFVLEEILCMISFGIELVYLNVCFLYGMMVFGEN